MNPDQPTRVPDDVSDDVAREALATLPTVQVDGRTVHVHGGRHNVVLHGDWLGQALDTFDRHWDGTDQRDRAVGRGRATARFLADTQPLDPDGARATLSGVTAPRSEGYTGDDVAQLVDERLVHGQHLHHAHVAIATAPGEHWADYGYGTRELTDS